MPAGKRTDLEPVKDEQIISRYFRYAAEFSETVSCFVEDLNLRFDTIAREFHKDKNEFQLDITDNSFKAMSNYELVAVGKEATLIRLSFSVGDVLYFAGSRTVKRFNRSLYVEIEHPIYKLQRRNAMRIKPMVSHGAKVNIEALHFDVFDISASGLSVIIPKELEVIFPKGRILRSMLSFSNSECKVGLEVTSMTRLKKDDEKNWKIGFKFKNIPSQTEQMIAREAYLHTHKIWGKWI